MDWLWWIVLFALGVVMLAEPKALWKLEHFLTVRNGEPTELYLLLMRLGGIFFLLAAVVCAVFLAVG